MRQEITNLKKCGFTRSMIRTMMIYAHPILCHKYLDNLLDEIYGCSS